MGIFESYFLAVLCLTLCFVVSAATFAFLFFNKWPKFKKGIIIVYYIALMGLTFSWLNIFFSDILPLAQQESRFIVYTLSVLFCFVIFAFFSFVLLKGKKEKNNLLGVIGSGMMFIALFSSLNFTLQYSFIREQERIDKNYEEVALCELRQELDSFPRIALVIPGGSLCYTLGVTKEEALKLAKANNLKYYYKDNKLIVIVHPGDEFVQVGDVWILKSILLKGGSQ